MDIPFPINTANGPTGGAKEEARELIERFRLIQPHLEDDRPLKAVAIDGRKARKTAADAVRLFKVHPATVSRLLAQSLRQIACKPDNLQNDREKSGQGRRLSNIYKRNHFVESWKASRAGTALEKGPKIYFAPRHFF